MNEKSLQFFKMLQAIQILYFTSKRSIVQIPVNKTTTSIKNSIKSFYDLYQLSEVVKEFTVI